VDVLVDVVVASVVVVDELVLVEVDVLVLVEVLVDVVVAIVVVVDELVLVEVDVLVVVGGAAMVSVPGGAGTIVIVRGPLCASMLDGVNVNTPLALAVNAPTLISTISPAPFPMTMLPVPVSKAMRIVPLAQVIVCSSGDALVRVWQPPVVQAEQSPATAHAVPPLEQSDVQAFAVEVTSVMAFGLTSVAQNVGSKSTLKASVVRSGPV
jgi:hypothetical protein